jgi:two-component system cell cycle sensor histidine kinase PleC
MFAPGQEFVTFTTLTRRSLKPIANFFGDIGHSLFPRTAADLRLVDEQLTLARNATWTNVFVMPLAAAFVALANASWVSLPRLIAWPLVMCIATISCDLYYRHLLKLSDHSPADIVRRARAFARLTVIQTLVWCSAAFIFWVPGNADNHALLILIMACTLSGWSSMGAFHLATGVGPLPLYLLSLASLPLLEKTPNEWFLVGMCVAFWVLMRALFMSNYRTRERMIRLEHERAGLIGNLKTAKEESDAARERAETASRAKSAFLANMSHELRTPLNAILGFSEIINTKAMGPSVSDQYSEYAGHIHGSGRHLLSLINDILDLAKIEAGRLVLREADVDLGRLIDDVVGLFATLAEAGGISLAVDQDRSSPLVHGDERALRQIVVNLLSNAIKFTPPAGRVTVFANLLADGSFAFGVDDTGVGIAPEDHEKVFESFGQGRHDAVFTDKGTGLGLPIVRGLAEAHGGHVILNSAPNEGTRVTVVLPGARIREAFRAAS